MTHGSLGDWDSHPFVISVRHQQIDGIDGIVEAGRFFTVPRDQARALVNAGCVIWGSLKHRRLAGHPTCHVCFFEFASWRSTDQHVLRTHGEEAARELRSRLGDRVASTEARVKEERGPDGARRWKF
jgi:hypothetical protein